MRKETLLEKQTRLRTRKKELINFLHHPGVVRYGETAETKRSRKELYDVERALKSVNASIQAQEDRKLLIPYLQARDKVEAGPRFVSKRETILRARQKELESSITKGVQRVASGRAAGVDLSVSKGYLNDVNRQLEALSKNPYAGATADELYWRASGRTGRVMKPDEISRRLQELDLDLGEALGKLRYAQGGSDRQRRKRSQRGGDLVTSRAADDGSMDVSIRGAAALIAKAMGYKAADLLNPKSQAYKEFSAYVNALQPTQTDMRDLIRGLSEFASGTSKWSQNQQKLTLKENPDLLKINSFELGTRGVAHGLGSPTDIIRAAVMDSRTRDELSQFEKVQNTILDGIISSSLGGAAGGVGKAAAGRILTEGLKDLSKLALFRAAQGVGTQVVGMAPDFWIEVRKLQNSEGISAKEAAKRVANSYKDELLTTKFIDPESEVGWGDRALGLFNQLGTVSSIGHMSGVSPKVKKALSEHVLSKFMETHTGTQVRAKLEGLKSRIGELTDNLNRPLLSSSEERHSPELSQHEDKTAAPRRPIQDAKEDSISAPHQEHQLSHNADNTGLRHPLPDSELDTPVEPRRKRQETLQKDNTSKIRIVNSMRDLSDEPDFVKQNNTSQHPHSIRERASFLDKESTARVDQMESRLARILSSLSSVRSRPSKDPATPLPRNLVESKALERASDSISVGGNRREISSDSSAQGFESTAGYSRVEASPATHQGYAQDPLESPVYGPPPPTESKSYLTPKRADSKESALSTLNAASAEEIVYAQAELENLYKIARKRKRAKSDIESTREQIEKLQSYLQDQLIPKTGKEIDFHGQRWTVADVTDHDVIIERDGRKASVSKQLYARNGLLDAHQQVGSSTSVRQATKASEKLIQSGSAYHWGKGELQKIVGLAKWHPNKKRAGQIYKGVPFDDLGFPIMDQWATRDVEIQLTGNRHLDESMANAAAGLKSTPPGYTWHHDHRALGKMLLVPAERHGSIGHLGGFGLNKIHIQLQTQLQTQLQSQLSGAKS